VTANPRHSPANPDVAYSVWSRELDPRYFPQRFRARLVTLRDLERIVRDLKFANNETPEPHAQAVPPTPSSPRNAN
jgi:hypothetical protein